jgi:hypothetical protein
MVSMKNSEPKIKTNQPIKKNKGENVYLIKSKPEIKASSNPALASDPKHRLVPHRPLAQISPKTNISKLKTLVPLNTLSTIKYASLQQIMP